MLAQNQVPRLACDDVRRRVDDAHARLVELL
jgi:hypothetical protein